ncbi:MAG: hypothetical protein NC312_08875 [Bacteroides fragilis]|nr:hypothetical protein [Bacteroides fragilis]
MGKKDTIGKVYFRDAARFAELMNCVLYRGEKVILPENLIPVEREYPSLFGNTVFIWRKRSMWTRWDLRPI